MKWTLCAAFIDVLKELKSNTPRIHELLDRIEGLFSSNTQYLYLDATEEPHARAAILPAPLEDYSYRSGLPRPQRAVLNIVLASMGIAGRVQPVLCAAALSWGLFGLFCTLIVTRLTLIVTGFTDHALRKADRGAAFPDHDLPVFSILVAAYQEAAMMPPLAAALRAIDWPERRLDILILLEADDPETIRAAHAATFPSGTQIILVPPGGPRTKPNALNHGLTLARGEFVTVYDVEDQPHPQQIRAAYLAFLRAPMRTVCVQARLVAGHSVRNWISAHWALEYDVQFGLLMRGLSLYRMPILLGGTSNHIRRVALLALGGWDRWNVTEDADLGMRLARARLLTKTINTPTREMAPLHFSVWLAQRSRWLKGFLQTWLVLMRNPGKTIRQMGVVPFIVMQLTLGGAILTSLAQAPFAALTLFALISGHLQVGAIGLGLLSAGILVGFIGDVAAPGEWNWRRVFAVLTRPLYWPLHSLAAYRALWELANRPFFWAKTPHHPRDAEPEPSSFSTGSSA